MKHMKGYSVQFRSSEVQTKNEISVQYVLFREMNAIDVKTRVS